ncbi:MAG: M90 family metallopeptidase [Burkholderiales bacterium]
MLSLFKNWFASRATTAAAISDDVWCDTLAAMPFLSGFSDDDLNRLRNLVEQFLHDKQFSAAAGLDLSDAMRVFIATQACLPILNLGIASYKGWNEIIIYPRQFSPRHEYTDEAGVVHVSDHPLAGESWLGGPVVLSWEDAALSGFGDGYNVVIHEFAHKLDMLNGEPNGFPPLHKNMSRIGWSLAFKTAFEKFKIAVNNKIDTEIDPYAAEDPAEFFAVMTEAFFEMPDVVSREFPDVYQQLTLFYRQNPLQRLHAKLEAGY